uniref:hypothetical protein n=1 Tax=Pedobacter schmidteae TaxID=2201271 RepID=UPI000EB03539|nr:hypothetical protein [Pedobacter schmidteae]
MKKLIFIYIQATLLLLLAVSCRKELSVEATASLTIVNAIPGSGNLVANLNTNYTVSGGYASGIYVKYRTYVPDNHLTIQAKQQPLLIYKTPAVNAQDKPFYQLTLNPTVGEASTLFLFGTLEHPEKLLVTKMPPYHAAADSLFGLRIINLAAAKTPVRIRISGEGTSLSVSNLTYQAVTDYLTVNANIKVGDVLIEIFDQISGVLLKTYTLKDVGTTTQEKNLWRYRNYTLVWGAEDTNSTLVTDPFLIQDF